MEEEIEGKGAEAIPNKEVKPVGESAAEAIPDKESKAVETAPTSTTSKGEYYEDNVSYLQGLNPDVEINDDNYVSTMEKSLAESIRPKMQAYDSANTNLKAMIHGDPKLGMVLSDMAKGAKFEEALPRHYDPASFTMAEGDPDYLAWEAANTQRKADFDKDLDRQTQMSNARLASEKTIGAWFEESKMDDDAKKEYGAFVSDMLEKAYSGEVTSEFLNKMKYAMDYKDDVAKATEVGEVKGRNEKIVTEKMAEDTSLKGDNLPVIDGGGATEKVEELPDTGNPLVQSLRGMSNRKSVIPGNNY